MDQMMERRLQEWREHERWWRGVERRRRRRRRTEMLQAFIRWVTGRV